MQKILMRLQDPVEYGSQADGGEVDHEERQQLSTQSDLIGIEVAEKRESRALHSSMRPPPGG